MYRKKLRNLYELLETGNNKKLIQEVDKLLATTVTSSSGSKKKSAALKQLAAGIMGNEVGYDEQVSLTVAKALKCLALARSSRKQESDRLIDELLNENTSDENALNVIMQYCKETQQLTKIVSFYENATQKFEKEASQLGTPEHEDILTSLFYAYVRNRDFAKQQQVSLKLYKLTNKMMFTFWNAASYVMMSKANKQQSSLYLTLGEKILQKAYDENKMEFNGEFLLYLNILEEKQKFAEALKIIDEFDESANLSKVGQMNFKISKKIFYFKKLNNWSELKSLCEDYLKSNNNDWLVYLDYFDSLENLFNKNNIEFIEEVLSYLNNLKEECDVKIQGPFLARIEFVKRVLKLNPVDSMHSLIDRLKLFIQEYLVSFSGKPGFYFDFIYFKDFFIERDLSEFVLSVLKCEHDKNRPFRSVKSIYTCLSYWQIHRLFGRQEGLDREGLVGLASELETAYTEALEFGKDLLPTGFQYADEFVILATHLRYDSYKRFNDDENNLVQLVVNLKHALTASPSNYQLKLLLLNLYSHLGAFEALQSQYNSMEIKNIQHFSTASLLLVHNLRLGAYGQSQNALNSMQQFFTSNIFDQANFLVNCYKYGTFLKAMEICSFMDTVRKSLGLNLCLNNFVSAAFVTQSFEANEDEATLADFRSFQAKLDDHIKEISGVSSVFDSNHGILPDDESELAEILLDHNDKDVVYEWEPNSGKELTNKQYQTTINEQRKLLKLRSTLIRFADAFFQTILPNPEQQSDTKLAEKFDLYKKSLLNFNFKFDYGVRNEDDLDSAVKITVTKSMYLNRWTELKLDQILNVFIHLTSDLISAEEFLDNEQKNEQKCLVNYKSSLENFYESLREKVSTMRAFFEATNETRLEKISRVLESFSAVLEAFSYIITLFTLCLSSAQLKPIWTEKVKKSKKKKGLYVQYAASVDLLFQIYEQLCLVISFFGNVLKETICPNIVTFTQPHLNKQPTFKTLNQTTTTTTAGNTAIYLASVSQSYSKSFDELKMCFNLKLKYLTKFSGNTQLTAAIQSLKI